jgi:hypothetical protein
MLRFPYHLLKHETSLPESKAFQYLATLGKRAAGVEVRRQI